MSYSRWAAAAVGVLAVPAFSAVALGAGGGLVGLPKSCPSAAIVNAALGQKNKAPTVARSAYAIVCTYRGSGPVPTRITFQVDTAATFAAGEKAASALGVRNIHGLGKAAWAPKAGGGLYVFTGGETLKIVSPLTNVAKLEALARKLL
jgi:hypothetical protein